MKNYNQLLQEVILESRQLNIPISQNIDPKVLINTRAKRFGQCKRRADKFLIELSSVFDQAEEKMAKQTLAHEIIHTCPNSFDHQAQWKSHVSKMNRAYGYNISRTNSCENIGVIREILINAKYTIECQKCHTKTYKDRISGVIRNPEKYHCKCGGRLTVS
jgi:hypothetical protein